MAEVITFGEAMVVFISEETGEFKDVSDFTKGLAGAELNVAVGITRRSEEHTSELQSPR